MSTNSSLQQSFNNEEVTAKVSDFGLSKRMRPGEECVHGIRQGTPFFMAPEVSQRHELHPQSDVYGYGVMMWELMMGVPVCYETCGPDSCLLLGAACASVQSWWRLHVSASNRR